MLVCFVFEVDGLRSFAITSDHVRFTTSREDITGGKIPTVEKQAVSFQGHMAKTINVVILV